VEDTACGDGTLLMTDMAEVSDFLAISISSVAATGFWSDFESFEFSVDSALLFSCSKVDVSFSVGAFFAVSRDCVDACNVGFAVVTGVLLSFSDSGCCEIGDVCFPTFTTLFIFSLLATAVVDGVAFVVATADVVGGVNIAISDDDSVVEELAISLVTFGMSIEFFCFSQE